MIAAEELGRKWIGIDITYMSVDLLKKRMIKHWGYGYAEGHQFTVEGEPTTIDEVKSLISERGRFRFQEWIIIKVGGIPNTKKTADKGEDGSYNWFDNNEGKKAVISVKSGHVNPVDIRELGGTMEREKAVAGIFLTLEQPTEGMIDAQLSTRFIYDSMGKRYPRVQILTVEDILNGKKVDLPR
jgi:hypothetical protein